MIARIFLELGAWNWIVLGCLLLALEILLPGMFLLWIGIAAILTGALALLPWNALSMVWQVQIIVFMLLALISAYAGSRLMRGSGAETDQPLLNRRREQLIGREATLTEAILNGRGRVRIGDTTWRVAGPDLPAGTKVRIAGITDSELIVEAA